MTLSPDLREAYQRPCFVCRQIGYCNHREPQVELAIVRVQESQVRAKPQVKGAAA